MFKMNKKGFTLIELIAVIILLSLILVIAVPNLIDTYRQSKLKSEEMFLKQLTKSIESYVSLEASSFIYEESFPANKTLTKKIYNRDTQKYEEQETTLPVTVYKSSNKSIKDVIEKKIIEENDYINPGNKNKKCSINNIIEIYRDSDYVYCFKIKKEDLECLTDEYKTSEALKNTTYAINTCIWKQ